MMKCIIIYTYVYVHTYIWYIIFLFSTVLEEWVNVEDLILLSQSKNAQAQPKNVCAVSSSKPSETYQIDLELERKRKSGYKNSLRYLKKLSKCDPNSLSPQERKLKKKHPYRVKRYDTACEQSSHSTEIMRRPYDVPQTPKDVASPAHRKALRSKRQRFDDSTEVAKNKRLKPSASLNSPPELLVAISDRQRPGGKLTNSIWFTLEEKIPSVYLPYEDEEPLPPAFKHLLHWAHRNRLEIPIECHAKVHHSVRRSSEINSWGESFLDFILHS